MKNNPPNDENVILENENNDPALKKSMKQYRKTIIIIFSIVMFSIYVTPHLYIWNKTFFKNKKAPSFAKRA